MIYEDPDELGYSTQPRDLSALIVCNAILPKAQQEDILLAAINAQNGYDIGAERYRKQAGYDSVGFRKDADCAGIQ